MVKPLEYITKKRSWAYRVLRLSLALLIGGGLSLFDLDYVEYTTYDWRTQLKPPTPTSGHLVTVAIDKDTLNTLGEKVSYDHLKTAVENVYRSGASRIILFLKPEDLIGNKSHQVNFAEFAQNKPVYFALNDIFAIEDEVKYRFAAPMEKIKVLPAPLVIDKKIYARDGATRRAMFSYNGNLTMFPYIASDYNGITDPDDYRGVYSFISSQQALIDFRPSGSYAPLSFVNLIKNQHTVTADFSNKVVLIGSDALLSSEDYQRTPYSKEVNAMSNLEVYANILDTFILNSSPSYLHDWIKIVITCLVSVLSVFVVLQVSPARGLAVIGTSVMGLLSASWILLVGFQLVMPLAQPLLAIFVCYYFFIPYRLIVENRRSWEYYHKNKLLTQVEELKSNFLRMMSHDLKTPLARIQGMTDIVMRQPTSLTAEQKQALETISQSSEELTEFIGSILDLGRIESKEVKLNLKSKDINSLLEEVLRKHQFQAQSKKIEIVKEFEPLFSVTVDEDLMKQVFSNLIENAIKYSPSESKILVSTEERDGKIFVQVADQGMGIPKDEQKEIFMKFYRSQNASHSPIKGSGLGLYLASYFTELHNGHIYVESELNQGSTFTVELPMEL